MPAAGEQSGGAGEKKTKRRVGAASEPERVREVDTHGDLQAALAALRGNDKALEELRRKLRELAAEVAEANYDVLIASPSDADNAFDAVTAGAARWLTERAQGAAQTLHWPGAAVGGGGGGDGAGPPPQRPAAGAGAGAGAGSSGAAAAAAPERAAQQQQQQQRPLDSDPLWAAEEEYLAALCSLLNVLEPVCAMGLFSDGGPSKPVVDVVRAVSVRARCFEDGASRGPGVIAITIALRVRQARV